MANSPSKDTANGHDGVRPDADQAPPANGEQGQGGLIAEAEALRNALHDACGRATRLVATLRRQRKQSRLVATTLASLKQLQQIEG